MASLSFASAIPNQNVNVVLEYGIQDNKVTVWGDIYGDGNILYNQTIFLILYNPLGHQMYYRELQIPPIEQYESPGFTYEVQDLDTASLKGIWEVEAYFAGTGEWTSKSSKIQFEVQENSPETTIPPETIEEDNRIPTQLIIRSQSHDVTKQNMYDVTFRIDPPIQVNISYVARTSLDIHQGYYPDPVQLPLDSNGECIKMMITDEEGSVIIRASFAGNSDYKGCISEAYYLAYYQPKDQYCIIATAAYGSPMHPDVLQMRSLRDDKVRSSFTGDNFVNVFLLWYYSWSPPVASVISRSTFLRGIFRVLLTPLVYTMRVSEKTYDLFATMPELAACVSILTSAALCGVFYITPFFLVLDRFGVGLCVSQGRILVLGFLLVLLSVVGSLVGSVFLNTLGFGSLAVLVTVSIAHTISKLINPKLYPYR